jgi:hypothetical protein
MLLLVLFVLPALMDAGPVVSNRQSSHPQPFNNHLRRHQQDHQIRSSSTSSGVKGRQISDRKAQASQSYSSYENARGNNPNDLYTPSTQYAPPSIYEQEASSLVSGLLVTRLAEDCKY